jgi:hypothetical protein
MFARVGCKLRQMETGGPPAKPPTREGFDTGVIKEMLRRQMKGQMTFDLRVEGLWCEVTLRA